MSSIFLNGHITGLKKTGLKRFSFESFNITLIFMRVILSIIVLLSTLSLYAQDNKAETKQVESKPVEEYSEDDFEVLKKERLKRIRKELVIIRSEINGLKEKEKENLDMLARIQIESKIQKLEAEYTKKRNFFIQTITNINLGDDDTRKKETTFSEDIKQILDPALSTFKKISERPRKMQNLNDRLTALQEQYNESQVALKRLKEFQKESKDKLLKWKLIEAIRMTEKRTKRLKVQLEDLRFQILKMENGQESIVSTFSGIIFDFIKTKGKNLMLSIVVFILFFWLFKLGQTRFIDLVLFKVARSDNKEVYTWVIRPTKVIYNVLSTLVAFFLSILTLYVLNDWLLVTLVLILFAAIVWSSKQYIPMFLEQSKIVLNLGSVREGERVIYNGLPYMIESLGYYCKLINPDLGGAYLRVNTKELINAHSRRASDHEPWFVTRVEDWVEVDGIFAQVYLQSPEQVILKMIGGEFVYYSASDFIQKTPKNLSNGFCIDLAYGLDYGLQSIIIGDVIPNIEKRLQASLYNEFSEVKESFLNFEVAFLKANTSSLDLRIFLQCDGRIASQKLKLERFIQKELVLLCNKFGYTIPFNQLTVHLPDGK